MNDVKELAGVGSNPTLEYFDITRCNHYFQEAAMTVDEWLMSLIAKEKINKPSFVYWQSSDKVDFGSFVEGKLAIGNGYEPRWRLLEDLRIFNNAEELHVWKGSSGLEARYIQDVIVDKADGEKLENGLIQSSKLWGTKAQEQERGLVLVEDRGMRLSLPCTFEQRYGEVGIDAFLEEHHYLKEDEATGFVTITDRRFARILIASEDGRLTAQEVKTDA